MADVFSPTGPSFLKGLVFILEGLVDSRFAGGHSWDIDLGFGLLFYGWPPVPRSLVAAVLSLIPRNVFLGVVTSGDYF